MENEGSDVRCMRLIQAVVWMWVVGVLVGYILQFGPIIEHLAGALLRAVS